MAGDRSVDLELENAWLHVTLAPGNQPRELEKAFRSRGRDLDRAFFLEKFDRGVVSDDTKASLSKYPRDELEAKMAGYLYPKGEIELALARYDDVMEAKDILRPYLHDRRPL